MNIHTNRIVIVGFGNIGQALLPLLSIHFPTHDLYIFEKDADLTHREICARYSAHLSEQQVTDKNYRTLIGPLLREGDYLLNLATSVSTCDLIRLAQTHGAFYLDTCIDPWEYAHTASGIQTSNYELRERVRDLRGESQGLATAVVAHGANPGFVSILLKQGLIEMAQEYGVTHDAPQGSEDWARLAQQLDVRVVQISERDTQAGTIPRSPGEFVSTWSVDGLVTECLQPAELGWGTHEATLPANARTHQYGCKAAIYLDQPSCTVKVKSWSPNALDFEAYLITHNEALSIADHLTVRVENVPIYRPTVYYAYRPCDEAADSMALLADGTARQIQSTRILKDEIVAGIDELGVFIISGTYPSLWIGSNLSIGKARKIAEHNNATSLQVVSSVVGAMAWMQTHPREGVLESDDLDHQFLFQFTEPYWAPIVRQFTHWKPLADEPQLQFQDFLACDLFDKHYKSIEGSQEPALV